MNEPFQTDDPMAAESTPAFDLGDLYYVFFRHKWKITLIFVASVVAAAAIWAYKPRIYFSEAKILIKYILEASPSSRAAGNAQIKSLDSRADGIIGAEVEILTSFDLATQVAQVIGPEKILGSMSRSGDEHAAAAVIRENLRVSVAKSSGVLVLSFRHTDPALVRKVLAQVIDSYITRHKEIHQGAGVLDSFLLGQADQLRLRLNSTDEELKKLKEQVNIISLEDDKKSYIDRLAAIRTKLMEAEAELAQRSAVVESLRHLPQTTTASTEPGGPVISREATEEYAQVLNYIEGLKKAVAGMADRYTDEHHLVRSTKAKLNEQEARKKELEDANPGLGRDIPVLPPAKAAATAEQLTTETLRVTELEALVKTLNEQLRQVGAEAARVAEVEPKILELERNKKVDEENYQHAKSSIERAHIDESTGAGKVTNLPIVEKPSPAARELGGLKKPLMLLLAFGCFGGFAMAFVWEKFINRSIKRVVDLERAVDIPLFISVPDSKWAGKSRFRRWWRRRRKTSHAAKPGEPSHGPLVANGHARGSGDGDVLPWDPQHDLRPYFEGLRDRLITYFEVRKMTHKPKLVAVTSCKRGAGVSTMAAGLAATLSETGDGNVLLVDMNIDKGAVHPFHQGLPGCALSEALEQTTREPAQIQDNLYVVTAQEGNSSKLPSVLPKRFAHLIPKMKASDYDYIIFDMPPVSQTSVTARLAGFMDMMLMVIESEKTGQEIVQRASGLLNESRANLATVLNKHRAYVPPALSQEL